MGGIGGALALSSGRSELLFLLVAPLGRDALVLTAVIAPRSDRSVASLDPLGAGLLTVATVTLILGIIQGPDQGWANPIVIGAFVAATVLWAIWVLAGLRARHPLLEPRLFTRPMPAASCVGMMLAFLGTSACSTSTARSRSTCTDSPSPKPDWGSCR